MKKLIIVAHGIGDHPADFHLEWEKTMRKNCPGDYEVAGLWWEDILQKVEEKYPLIEKNFADAVKKFGFKELSKVLSSSAYKKINDYFMDVLVYTAMGDMTDYIQTSCAIKLKQIIADRNVSQENVILIGHSLGAAMLPHIVWRERVATGTIPYGGLILLASPLGMESPIPALIKDLLGTMPEYEGNRTDMLRQFAFKWEVTGSGRLHFLINQNDIVCADVKIKAGPLEKDFIPIRQGFNEQEKQALTSGSPDCVHIFSEGSTDAVKVVDNHDVQRYLQRQEFVKAFQGLIQ